MENSPVQLMKDSGSPIRSMGWVDSNGLMAVYTLESGETIKCMGLASSCMKTATSSKVTGSMVSNKAMVC